MGNCLTVSDDDNNPIYNAAEESSEMRGRSSVAGIDGPPPPYQEHYASDEVNIPVYHTTPTLRSPASQLSEEDQIRIAQRIGLIQHLPKDIYVEGNKTDKECVICMLEFEPGDSIRFLPCLHTYHAECIDDWLMRSFTCPSCMEPVDSALITSYFNQLPPTATGTLLATSVASSGSLQGTPTSDTITPAPLVERQLGGKDGLPSSN